MLLIFIYLDFIYARTILERTKAYNVVVLVEFIAIIWDKYFTNHLLDYVFHSWSKNIFESLIKKMTTVSMYIFSCSVRLFYV